MSVEWVVQKTLPGGREEVIHVRGIGTARPEPPTECVRCHKLVLPGGLIFAAAFSSDTEQRVEEPICADCAPR